MSINRFGKAIAVATSLVVGLSLAGSAMALTSADISMLQAAGIINASQAASLLASIGGAPVSTGSFTRNLTVGSTGADVTALQNMLGVSPSTGYFGPKTKAAVIAYQLAHGISPAAGYVGPITRASLNGGSTGGVVYAPGTDLKVALAPTSPLASAIIRGQAAADLAEFTFTNTSNVAAVVTNVTLNRGGVAADSDLSNVYLYQGAARLTDAASVSSGKVTFNAAAGLFTVPAGSSITVAVRADIDGSVTSSGQIVTVSLVGVTSNVPVSAVYPVTGSSMTIANVTDLAQATSTLNITSGGSIQAGSLNQTVWSSALALSGRAVWLKSLAVKVIGSIPTDGLQNLTLYVSGTQVAKALGIDANGMVTFDLSSAPYKIDSSRTLEVRADVVKGSSRTFIISLQNASDVQLVDSNYNVGLTIGLSGTQDSGTWTVNGTTGGSVVVTLDTSLSSGDVITGSSNVPLARYTLKAYGEDIKVSQLNATTSHSGGLQNIALYANGVQIGSTQTVTVANQTAGASKLFNLGSSLILPAGQAVTVELRGDIKNADGTNATTTGGGEVFTSAIEAVAGNAQGRESSAISTTTGFTTGPTMTVKAAGVTLSKNTGYQDQSTLPNQAFKIGSFTLQTTSAEGVTLSGLTVTLNNAGAGAYTNLSNLYVVSGSYTSPSVNPSSSGVNNFTLSNFTVPANGSRTIDVYANLGASTSGIASTTLSISGYGSFSNTTVSKSAIGQTITLGSGTVAVPTLKAGAFTVTPRFVVGGSSFVTGTYNFVSSNGTSYLNELTFSASGTSASGIVSVTVGGVTQAMSAGAVTLTGLNIPVAVAPGSNVPVTVNYNNVAYTGGVPSNETAGLTLTGYKYTSGNTQTSTTTVSVDTAGMTLLNSAPRISVANSAATLTGGNQKLASFTVAVDSQDPAGQVSLLTLPISITTTGTATAQGAGSMTVKVNGTDLVSNGQATIAALAGDDITAGTGTATTTITFVGGYDISKGTSVTFDFYDTADGGATAGSVSTRLGAAANVTFNDTVGSSTATVTGSLIYNYSTTDNSTLTF